MSKLDVSLMTISDVDNCEITLLNNTATSPRRVMMSDASTQYDVMDDAMKAQSTGKSNSATQYDNTLLSPQHQLPTAVVDHCRSNPFMNHTRESPVSPRRIDAPRSPQKRHMARQQSQSSPQTLLDKPYSRPSASRPSSHRSSPVARRPSGHRSSPAAGRRRDDAPVSGVNNIHHGAFAPAANWRTNSEVLTHLTSV